LENIREARTQTKTQTILLIIVLLLMSYCSNPIEVPVEVPIRETKPEIISKPVTYGSVNQQYSYDVNTTGNSSAAYTLTTSPPGMTIDPSTGMILWIPSANNDFKVGVTVKATNEFGSSSQTFYIRVGGLQIEGWETSIFPIVNMEQAKIDSFLTLRENGSYPKIHSVIVIKDGKLVLEEYFRGIPYHWPFHYGQEIQFQRSMLHHNASATKSFISILMGIALENNFIVSLNEAPFDYFPEYESYLNWNDLKSQITLEHLITMTAGFDWQEDGESFFSLIYPTSDWIKSTLDLPVNHTPGNYWDYFSPGPDVLGTVISKASGLHLSEFARQYLFDPMGITDAEWYITPTRRAFGGGCHRMRPIDMAKIGFLILNNGSWQGQQIISPSWIAESTLERNEDYGYLWWKFDIRSDNSLIKSTVAAGFGGQRIYIIPQLDAVIVFTAGYYNAGEEYLGGLHTHEIITEYIVPSIIN